jgi:hypothetical protein
MHDPAVRHRYSLVVGAEFGLLGVGAVILGTTGLCLVVAGGAHGRRTAGAPREGVNPVRASTRHLTFLVGKATLTFPLGNERTWNNESHLRKRARP